VLVQYLVMVPVFCAAVGAYPADLVVHERIAVRDESGRALFAELRGGEVSEGVLRWARVVIVDDEGGMVWDQFDVGLHPWMLRSGRFCGREVLFVGVRKPAIFDPFERPRPFFYEVRAGGIGLRKVWLGTSLSRPFVTIDLGNLDGVGEDELVALEQTASGGLELSAYVWRGFGIEGVARSKGISRAREADCVDVWGGPQEEVVVRQVEGQRWRFVAYGLAGEELAPVAQASATVSGEGVAWSLIAADGAKVGCVELRGRATRRVRFRAVE